MAKRKKAIESSAARARRQVIEATSANREPVMQEPVRLNPQVSLVEEPKTYDEIMADIVRLRERISEAKSASIVHQEHATPEDYSDKDERAFVNSIIRRDTEHRNIDEAVYSKSGPERFFDLMNDGFARSSVLPYRGKER